MKDLLLSEYKPMSELRVEKHEIYKPKTPVIDIHTHMGSLLLGRDFDKKYNTDDFMEVLHKNGIVLSVNLDGSYGEETDRMLEKIKGYESRIINFGWVDTRDIDEPGFADATVKSIKEGYRKGLRGIKLWKYLSLGQKDRKGKYIAIDDDRLKPIWHTAAELGIPILIHIADPIAFFKEINGSNERFEQLVMHPDWSFSKPGLYGFDELMQQQESMLFKNPETKFIIAHFGSASEDLKFVARCLDAYPNMFIDTAARVAELGRQPYSSRDFFVKYQDRILFGTDFYPTEISAYDIYYRFLETKDEYFDHEKGEISYFGRWKIYGIYLPDDVLEKVYYKNAARILNMR
jgi:predicted TIM-barrel fold metal-dependent hydrolase